MNEMVEIPLTGHASVSCYVSRPETAAKGAVIVIHEVWGLTDHIKSVADRLAGEGYIALAPDLMTNAGFDTSGIAGMQEALFDPERRNQVQPELRKAMTPMQNPDFSGKVTAALKACFEYVYGLPETRQKVAVVGFCFGGTYSYVLATEEARLKLAVPYYGHANQDVQPLRRITCPVLAFYGEQDTNLMAGLEELKDSMRQAGVDFTAQVYPGCGHAFFNDTNRFAYNAAAAEDAWKRTLDALSSAMQ